MFGKLFGGAKAIETIQQPKEEIEFLGAVEGSGASTLRMQVALRLKQFTAVSNAHLEKIKYKKKVQQE